MKNRNDRKVTRREMVRGVTAAAAASALLGGTSMAQSTNKDETCCGSQPFPMDSVFTKVCNDKSASKYANGDNPAVYRLGAIWLMLATEDWTKFYRDPHDQKNEERFLQGLSDELKINLQDVQKLWEIGKAKSDSFEDIRSAWQDLTSNQGLYGARPCHGGKSILSIACLDPNDERTKPMLNLRAKGHTR